ncbi:MAG: SLC13 family permease [Lachnospiraceae bacterium]|nr:SLC13 family permease [Ruminococcus sp.]MCM1276672.1 SLC13 family permease [Lachnospiraceae bacterium]
MKSVVELIKKETVLCISGVLAIVSCFIVPPSAAYAGYIDFRTLILLLCLMLVVAGIRQTGAFTVICEALLKKFRSIKSVGVVLVLLSFFMSMLLTNDVTLVTVIPFTLLMFEGISDGKKIPCRDSPACAGNGGGKPRQYAHPDGKPSKSLFILEIQPLHRGILRNNFSLLGGLSDNADMLGVIIPAETADGKADRRSKDKRTRKIDIICSAFCGQYADDTSGIG